MRRCCVELVMAGLVGWHGWLLMVGISHTSEWKRGDEGGVSVGIGGAMSWQLGWFFASVLSLLYVKLKYISILMKSMLLL